MDSYPVDVDVDPEQVVRWLLVERQRGGSGLRTSAWLSSERHPLLARMEDRLGDEEREDLADETSVATLEIAPVHASGGWRMVISVAGESDPLADGEAPPGEVRESLELDSFYLDFLRPARCTVSVAAEVDSPEGEANLRWLLQAIETNAHVPLGSPSRTAKEAR
jgi:hypothetical protein